MSEELMHLFDWGVFKPFGELILVITFVFYCWAIWFSVKQWWVISLQVKNRFLAILPASVILLGMIFEAGNSLLLQTTSVHHQERAHMMALITICMGLTVSLTIGNAAKRKLLSKPSETKADPTTSRLPPTQQCYGGTRRRTGE